MDVVRFGSDVRLLRRRRGWSQRRLAAEATVSRWTVARIEAGRADRSPLDVLVAIVTALGGYLSVRILYQGEALDRLRDRRHASLVDAMVRRLRSEGWDVATEVTFNHFGERGSIDILAFHPVTRALLVVEVKTVVPDVGGMLVTFDRKVRLAAGIARDRGWAAGTVSKLLVLPEESTARRRIDDHRATFSTTFPLRNVAVNRWLRSPSGRLAGLLFLSTARPNDPTPRAARSAGRSPRTERR
jgi:transcriptional regulator with XRE-family HTH domain